MAFFGLKLGLDLEMRAAHPHQKFQRVPAPPRAHFAQTTVHESLKYQSSPVHSMNPGSCCAGVLSPLYRRVTETRPFTGISI